MAEDRLLAQPLAAFYALPSTGSSSLFMLNREEEPVLDWEHI